MAIYNLAMGLTVVVALNTTYYTHSKCQGSIWVVLYGHTAQNYASNQALVFRTKDGTDNRHLLRSCQRYIIAMLDYSAYKHEISPMTSNFGTETSRPTQTHGVLGLGIAMVLVMRT